MTDTPIADAWIKYYMPEMPSRATFERLTFIAGARACLAQVKPFLETYGKWLNSTVPTHEISVREAKIIAAYQALTPLLKELEEK